MKKNNKKVEKIKLIVQDIKKEEAEATLNRNTKNEILFKKKRFSKLSILVIALILVVLYMGIWLFEQNKSDNKRAYGESKKTLFYYTERIINTLSLVNFLPKKEVGTDEINLVNANKESDLGEILEETSSMKKSKNSLWWLNSGGFMYFKEDGFSTNIGALPEDSNWRKLYAESNSRDTDNGYFPQNIFRLVSRNKWKNFSQSVYFNIEKVNLSKSKYRNESNGVLLFNRYQDGDNLYYTGLRVDGNVIVKKKIEGEYFTILEKNIFKEKGKYDKNNNPNLIPENTWLGIKSELENTKDNKVSIKVLIDFGNGKWDSVIETEDEGDKYGKRPFLNRGYAGIRTDFMDVKFKNYTIEKK